MAGQKALKRLSFCTEEKQNKAKRPFKICRHPIKPESSSSLNHCKMDRRDFIKKGCAACLSATVLSSLVSSCTLTRYLSGELGNDGITVTKDDFKIKQKGSTAYSSFIIVRNDALKYPICVYRINEEEYAALWMRCSHQ